MWSSDKVTTGTIFMSLSRKLKFCNFLEENKYKEADGDIIVVTNDEISFAFFF